VYVTRELLAKGILAQITESAATIKHCATRRAASASVEQRHTVPPT
jgi:hypothetical protein